MDLLLEPFFRRVRDRPRDLAVSSRGEGRALDFAELAARADDRFRRLGEDPRPIAIAVGNGTAFVELFIAAWRRGVTAVAMDASSGPAARRTLCRRLGVARLVERGDGGAIRALELDAVDAAEPPPGTALIKLTSGSTGDPLAACFDAPSLAAGIRQIAEGMEITAADTVLMALPLSHSYGFDNGLLSLLAVGTPLVLEPSVYPADVLRAASTRGATVLPLVPPLVRSLSSAAWPATRLRRVLCAGGVLPASSARAFLAAAGRPVHNFYGSTETGGITFERRPLEDGAAGSVGQPLPGVELDFAADGRLSVRSAASLIGRLGGPPQTAPVRTGDLGHLGEDGRLRLTGRVADLLNVGGRKIATVEVEKALRGLDGVVEAAVVGVPDEVRGDRPVAFLVADRWPIELRSLPGRLRPRELHRVEALPHNRRGKLDRRALRRLAEELADRRGPAANGPPLSGAEGTSANIGPRRA